MLRDIIILSLLWFGLATAELHGSNYEFGYGVHDVHTGDIKNHHEERHGDHVNGHYSLIEPDGNKRIVRYYADEHNGFNAEVHREGFHSHNYPHPHTHPIAHPHPELLANPHVALHAHHPPHPHPHPVSQLHPEPHLHPVPQPHPFPHAHPVPHPIEHSHPHPSPNVYPHPIYNPYPPLAIARSIPIFPFVHAAFTRPIPTPVSYGIRIPVIQPH